MSAAADLGNGAEQGAFGRASTHAILAVAVGTIVAAAILDLLTPPEVVLIGLMIIGPLVASLRATPRQTAAVALFALALAIPLGVRGNAYPAVDHAIRIGVITAAGALAVFAAAQRHQRLSALFRVSRVAELAQAVMLRPPPKRLAGLAFAARYVSASSESRVGGDLYETAFTPTGVRVIVGDARGKGVEGIQLAATVLATFREAVWDGSLIELALAIDERVTKEAADEEDFVTAVLVEFPHEGGVSVVNCGHHPPIRISSAGLEELQPSEVSTPLGLAPVPRVDRYPFAVGDRLLACTDGLIEARNGDGAFFPVEEHVEILSMDDLQATVDALVGELIAHVPGDLDDDMAVMLVERVEADEVASATREFSG